MCYLIVAIRRSEFFYFLVYFLNFFHEYTSGGKILKSGPLAQRYRCWRRVYTSRRHRPWHRALRLEADVEVTWQEGRRQSPWRQTWRCRSWRRARRRSVTPNFKDKIKCMKLICAQRSVTHIS